MIKAKEFEAIIRKANIKNHIEYKGAFDTSLDKQGKFMDEEKVIEAFQDLAYSRLVMDTFPMGGSRSIIEVSYLDIPVVRLEFDDANWLTNQKLQPFRLPILSKPAGTANSLEDYYDKCQKVLYDEAFAQEIINEQNHHFKKLTNPHFFGIKFLKYCLKSGLR